MTATDTAVRAKAQVRVRAAVRSARSSENRTATAPAGAPPSVIGAITSQNRSWSFSTSRESTSPRRTRSTSARVKGRRRASWLVATTLAPPGSNDRMSSCPTFFRMPTISRICASSNPRFSNSRRSPIVAAISRANAMARSLRSSSTPPRVSVRLSAVKPNETTTSTATLRRTSLSRTPRSTANRRSRARAGRQSRRPISR